MARQPSRPVNSCRRWFLLVCLGSSEGRISPHNPKVAGSNPAPATSQIVEIKGADSIGLFDRQRPTMKLFDLHRLNNHPRRDARRAKSGILLIPCMGRPRLSAIRPS